jgi:MFS family permease
MGETTPLLDQEPNPNQAKKESHTDKQQNLPKNDQLTFVKKVLGTVATLLTLTFITAVISSASDKLGDKMGQLWLLLTAAAILIVTVIPLACSKSLRVIFPINLIMLLVITLAECVLVGSVSSLVTVRTVLTSIGMLSFTVSSLFAAAYFTPTMPKLLMYLIVGLSVSLGLQIIFFVVVFLFSVIPSWLTLLYVSFGVLGWGIFIIVDLVVFMTPDAIDMDDYVLGALRLYFDIFRLVIHIFILPFKQCANRPKQQ